MAVGAPPLSTSSPGRERASVFRGAWGAFRAAAWLGWQAESNWADPLLFAVYSVAKPLSHTLILMFMYLVVAQSSTDAGLFAHIYLGNALYMFVGQVMSGTSWAVIEDREFYRVIRYVVVASPHMVWYLLGRAVAKFAVTAAAVVIVSGVGILAFDLPVSLDWERGLYFALVFGTGIVVTALMGVGLAGVLMVTARHGEGIAEGVAGALYVLSAVVFPVDALPQGFQRWALALPHTYWLEGLRRAILDRPFGQVMAGLSNSEVLFSLVTYGAAYSAAGLLFFWWAERRARRLGIIDQSTEH